MKRINLMKVAVFLVLALFSSQSFAAQDAEDKPGASGAMGQGVFRVSQMMDKTVKDQEGNDLGQIEDVFFDNQGQALYGILAGPGNKYFPIPMQTLIQSVKEDDFVLDLNKERIEAAPSFSRDEWPDRLTESEWEQKIFSYYGAQPTSGTMTSPQSEGMDQPRIEKPSKEQPSTEAPTQPRVQ